MTAFWKGNEFLNQVHTQITSNPHSLPPETSLRPVLLSLWPPLAPQLPPVHLPGRDFLLAHLLLCSALSLGGLAQGLGVASLPASGQCLHRADVEEASCWLGVHRHRLPGLIILAAGSVTARPFAGSEKGRPLPLRWEENAPPDHQVHPLLPGVPGPCFSVVTWTGKL